MSLRHPSLATLVDFEAMEGRRRRRVAGHLAACPRCRARLGRLRALRRAAAEIVAGDAPAPDLWARIEARHEEGAPVILPLPPGENARYGPQKPRRRLAVAALLALLLSAGVGAAAVVFTPLGAPLRRTPDARMMAPPPPVPVGAIEVDVPVGGLTVDLGDAADDFALRVLLWEGERLALVSGGSPGESEGSGFRSGATRVEVLGTLAGTLEVHAPAQSGVVRIVARGRTIAVVRDGAVHAAGRAPVRVLGATVASLLAAGSPRDER